MWSMLPVQAWVRADCATLDQVRLDAVLRVTGTRLAMWRFDRCDAVGDLEKPWPGCRIDASAFVEKASSSRAGCP
jgi:hypothetical protein